MGAESSLDKKPASPPADPGPPRAPSIVQNLTDVLMSQSRNPKGAYFARIGVGYAGEVMQRYRGMTIEDFNVPKWLQRYEPPAEERKADREEVMENIASNESYNLSFVQPKSNDEIRRNFLQRMSYLGVLVPPSRRPPASNTSNPHIVIIYDWDDTLLCTSFLNNREDAMNIASKQVKAQLKQLEEAVIRLLTASSGLGSNYIITNAMKGWVEYSSSVWIPGVLPLLENITIVSARHEYEEQFPGDYHEWKVQAFLEMTKLFHTEAVTNLICLGDSNIEIDAAHTLASKYQDACIKTIKFRECPIPDELVKQLDLVTEKFEKICTSGKNMTIRLER